MEPLRVHTTLQAGVDTPAAARALVRDVVEDTSPLADDLTLVVSELVTNAVVSGSSEIALDVTVDGSRVLVEVADERADAPVAQVVPPTDVAGSGLMLVSRLAHRWGIRREGPRKVLWAALAAS